MSTTEAKYSFTTKINGDLFTIRGDSFDEFHTNVATAGLNISTFINDVAVLQAAGHAAPLVNTDVPAQPAAPEWATGKPAWQTSAPPPAAAAASVPQCQHGPRNAKKGSSAKGEWRAWMCPTPKGTPGQCEPQWVQKNSAEWAGFPA